MKKKYKILVDFNNTDPLGRVRLLGDWKEKDIDQPGFIPENNLIVEVYDFDLSADGILEFSDLENIWTVKIDWGKLTYKN